MLPGPGKVTIDGDLADWDLSGRIWVFADKAEVRLACDGTNLYAIFEVTDATPWLNEGKDFTRLFKTGDAVDLQLAVGGGGTTTKRSDVAAGDSR